MKSQEDDTTKSFGKDIMDDGTRKELRSLSDSFET